MKRKKKKLNPEFKLCKELSMARAWYVYGEGEEDKWRGGEGCISGKKYSQRNKRNPDCGDYCVQSGTICIPTPLDMEDNTSSLYPFNFIYVES